MKKEQTLIRNKIYGIALGIVLVCMMLLAACDNTLNSSDENGYGKISISFEGGAASQTTRTILPSTAFDKYVYIFTKSGGAAVEKTPDKNGLFTLELGNYTVEVKAYIGVAEPYTLVASGVSSQFTVSSGSNAAVVVFLSEVNAGGKGKFSYTITYPAGATAEITLQKWPGLNNIALNPGNIANGKTQTLQLDTGSYLLAVLVNKNGSSAGISEAVHITSSLSTVYTKNFNDNDLIAPIAVLNVTVKPSTSLVVGGTEMLYAEIEPSYATNKSVTWSSSDPDVATVSANGLITAKKAGTANITVTTVDGSNKTATCNVTVSASAVDVTGVSLDQSSVSLYVGDTETLVATLEPSNATNQNITWSSTNTSVATVSASGTVTAVALGNATITVTTEDGGKKASCNVTVTIPTFTTVTAFKAWLDAQPANTKEDSYAVALNLNSLEGLNTVLIDAYSKYVNLDFSGSTFTSIGDMAFAECTGLTNVIIPNSVTSIRGDAFIFCTSLTSITIPNSVTSIGGYAFSTCTSLASVTIPDSVTSIGGYAFSFCTSLTSVTIGNSVTSIVNAFTGCTSLVSVTIGNSVTSIDSAFVGCTSLVSVTIPDSVTSIGGAFYECTSLASVTIPNSVTSIVNAFTGCTSLVSVTIPNSVTSIGGAFIFCTSLASVTIPNSVTSIGDSAFVGCTSLASVTIPNSVTSIGGDAFGSCHSLASVTFQGTINSSNFSSTNSFPGDLRDKYLAGGIGTYTRPYGGSEWTKL